MKALTSAKRSGGSRLRREINTRRKSSLSETSKYSCEIPNIEGRKKKSMSRQWPKKLSKGKLFICGTRQSASQHRHQAWRKYLASAAWHQRSASA